MKIILVICIWVAVLIPQAAMAAIIYVDAGATSGASNGISWENAYIDLQSALGNAASGDEIWVSQGTYKPTIQFNPDDSRSAVFQMKNNIAVYGGFNGTEENRSNRDWVNNATILSGDIGIQGDDSDNCYLVFYHTESLALNSAAILDGITITEGASGMYNFQSSPTITNCTFSGNEGFSGIYNDHSSPTITNCTFSDNSANDYGGGMYNNYSSPAITNCIFSNNSADSYYGRGGGMYNNYSTPTITNCIFSNNSSNYDGGGIYNNQSSPTIINCTFSGNFA
ncbi:MAG: hypothetical protein GY869_05290, partial [Planctomycetes bacterium]|nr:hypothetical protein [Planctomycetota bacterium]